MAETKSKTQQKPNQKLTKEIVNEYIKHSNQKKLELINKIKDAVNELYFCCNQEYIAFCFGEKDGDEKEIKMLKELSSQASYNYFEAKALKIECERLEEKVLNKKKNN